MKQRVYMCQEKKEEEDSPELKIALIYRYDDAKTTGKITRKTNYNNQK